MNGKSLLWKEIGVWAFIVRPSSRKTARWHCAKFY